MTATVTDHSSTDHTGHEDGHGHHAHPAYVAHHFETAEQQFDSGKLGIWLFLVTEILFFSGLFVAYTIYRVNHPEIFKYAHQFLNKNLGGLNTAVLLFSSLTMAWAVRCAQLSDLKGSKSLGQIVALSMTLFCASMFLGVKTFEYTEKYHKHLLWAGASVNAGDIGKKSHAVQLDLNEPTADWSEKSEKTLHRFLGYWYFVLIFPLALGFYGVWQNVRLARSIGTCGIVSVLGMIIGIQSGLLFHSLTHHAGGEGHGATHDTKIASAQYDTHANSKEEHSGPADKHNSVPNSEQGDKEPLQTEQLIKTEEHATATLSAEHVDNSHEDHGPPPRHANVFFSIYYFMTGLHAFHIIAGMLAISWLIVRAFNNEFHSEYFGPVDYVGLYWHLVDLIWIYLFPMLYLIK